MNQKPTKAERSRALRYKRPTMMRLGFQAIQDELGNITEACDDVRYYIDNDDGTLLDALGGDEEDEWEFKMAFADLSGKCDQLWNAMNDSVVQDEYDDFVVNMLGGCYRVLGWDSFEEDYCGLTRHEEEMAETEAGKRLMRHTKVELLATMKQRLGLLVAWLDIQQQFDYLKATIDIFRDDNHALLNQIREIDAAYSEAAESHFRGKAGDRFDKLLEALPDRAWVE